MKTAVEAILKNLRLFCTLLCIVFCMFDRFKTRKRDREREKEKLKKKKKKQKNKEKKNNFIKHSHKQHQHTLVLNIGFSVPIQSHRTVAWEILSTLLFYFSSSYSFSLLLLYIDILLFGFRFVVNSN